MQDVFERSCQISGGVSWKAAGFFSEENQYGDYVLLMNGLVAGKVKPDDPQEYTLLDVGCGQGDLYEFCWNHFRPLRYHGIDLSPAMLQHARRKYPKADFREQDFLDPAFQDQYDFIIAVGGYNVLVPDHEQYFRSALAKMYSQARIAVAFNVLSAAAWGSNERYAELFYYEPADVLRWCLELTNNVKLDHFSSEYELQVFLYK